MRVAFVTVNGHGRTCSPTIDSYQLGRFSKLVSPGAMRTDSPDPVTYRLVSTGTDNVSSGLPMWHCAIRTGPKH